jgi:hypothetical protein
MTDTSKTLRDCAQYIEEHGWTQGALVNQSGGVCALGAIRYATLKNAGVGDGASHAALPEGIREDQRAACEALAATISDMTDLYISPLSIPQWNDDSNTTGEDVVLMFKHAAERAESK